MTTVQQAITAVLSRPVCARLPEVFRDMLRRWAEFLAINRGLSANTVENYLHGAGLWITYLLDRDIAVEDATASDVNEWQRLMYVEGEAVSRTRALNLSAVRQFYAWREDEGMKGNPARNIKGPRKPRRLPRKFTDSQLQQIFAVHDRATPMGRRDFALLLFFYNTGARLSEVVDLKLYQLVLKQNTGAVKFFGKGAKERIVPFEGPVVGAMQEWLADRATLAHPDVDAVFIGLNSRSKGQPLGRGGIECVLIRALKRAKITKHRDDPFGIHRMRSTFATALYDVGKDNKTVQYLLGHEKSETTDIYIAISERQLQSRLPASKTEALLGMTKKVPAYVQEKIRFRN